MQLSGQQRKKLQEALIDAFPSKSSLKMMLRHYLDKNLDATAGGSNLEEIVFRLIEKAEAEAWTQGLICAARESNPGNIKLRDVAQELLKIHVLEPPSVPLPNIPPKLSNQGIVAIQVKHLSQGAIPNLWKLGIAQGELDQSRNSDRSSNKEVVIEPPSLEPDDCSVDYTPLHDLLATGKLKEANQETVRILLEVADRQERGWLGSQDIRELPCSVLSEIDQLWFQQSNGLFGLRVQRQIWVDLGGQPGQFDFTVFCKFGDRVGWRRNNDWLKKYDDFIFTLAAPKGHLPSLRFPGVENGTNCWKTWRESFEDFLSCVETCWFQ